MSSPLDEHVASFSERGAFSYVLLGLLQFGRSFEQFVQRNLLVPGAGGSVPPLERVPPAVFVVLGALAVQRRLERLIAIWTRGVEPTGEPVAAADRPLPFSVPGNLLR